MPCYYPLQGWRARQKNEGSGKYSVVFDIQRGFSDMPIEVPCGQCIGCRLERSRQWALRCVHESQQYEQNCFITLTYDDDHLPKDSSLNLKHFQDFFKRLRKYYSPQKIRFFHCGEYGEHTSRPHYHACLFNLDFSDKVLYKCNDQGMKLYTSEVLSKLWPFGFSTVGALTFETAAYTARYILKKQTGANAFEKYTKIDPGTGEVLGQIKPEYTTMSRRPGIGKTWFDSFVSDCYPSDFVISRGVKMRPPKYYDTQYEIIEPGKMASVKAKRVKEARKHVANNTIDRLRVRETCKVAQVSTLKRNLE